MLIISVIFCGVDKSKETRFSVGNLEEGTIEACANLWIDYCPTMIFKHNYILLEKFSNDRGEEQMGGRGGLWNAFEGGLPPEGSEKYIYISLEAV